MGTKTAKHTAGPWRVDDIHANDYHEVVFDSETGEKVYREPPLNHCIIAENGDFIVYQMPHSTCALPGAAANAAFIVRACNSHEALLEAACKAIVYDRAIACCANDPNKMASYCTAEGASLDELYSDWISSSIAAIAATEPTP